NAETDRHLVKKHRVRQNKTEGAKIVAGLEDQLIPTELESIPFQKWFVAAAVIVGSGAFQLVTRIATDPVEADRQAGRRLSGRRVQHVGSKPPTCRMCFCQFAASLHGTIEHIMTNCRRIKGHA